MPAWPATTFNYDFARRAVDMLNGLEPLTTGNDDLRHMDSLGDLGDIGDLRRGDVISGEQLEELRRAYNFVPEDWSFDEAWAAYKKRFMDANYDASWYEWMALREAYEELGIIVDSFKGYIPKELWPRGTVRGLGVDPSEWRQALVQTIEATTDPNTRMVLQNVLDQFDAAAVRVFRQGHDNADARKLGPLPPLPPSVDVAALEATLQAGLEEAQVRFLRLADLQAGGDLTAEQAADFYRTMALVELYDGALAQVRQGLDPTEYLKQEIAHLEDVSSRGGGHNIPTLSHVSQADDFRNALDIVLAKLRQHGINGLSLPSLQSTPVGVVADGSSVRHVNAAEGVGSWTDTVTDIARRGSTGAYDTVDVFDGIDLDAAAVARFTGDSATATLTPAQRAEDFAGLTDASGPYSIIMDADADGIQHVPTDVQGDDIRVIEGQYSVLDDPEIGRGGYSELDAPPDAPSPPPPNKVPKVNTPPRLSPDNYSVIEDMITASDDPYTSIDDVISGRVFDSATGNYTSPTATAGVDASGDAVELHRVPDPPAAQLSGEQQRLVQFYEPAPAPGYDFEFVTWRGRRKGEDAPPIGTRWKTSNWVNGRAVPKPDGVYGDIEFRTIGLVEQRINYRDSHANKAILAADPKRATEIKGSVHSGAPDVIKRTTPDGWDEFGRPVFELDKGETWRLDHGALTFEFLDPTTMQKVDPSQVVVKPYAGDTADALAEIKRGLLEDAATGQRYRDLMQSRYDAYKDWHAHATFKAGAGSFDIDTRPPMPTPHLTAGFAPTHPGTWVQLDPADEFLSYLQWQGPMKANGKFY